MRDQIDYPGKLVARLVTEGLTPYVLLADTLAVLHAQLLPDMMRTKRQTANPPGVVKIWFSR